MNNFLKRNLYPLLGIFGFLLMTNCDKNACEDIVCPVNQQCVRGQCFCIDGYEGANCAELAYLKYVGTYNVSESCQGGPPFGMFTGTIAASGFVINELLLLNFLNSGQNAVAYIGTDANNQANYIRIPNQNLGGSAFTIAGEGSFLDFGGFNRIQLEVQVTQAGIARFCTIIYQ